MLITIFQFSCYENKITTVTSAELGLIFKRKHLLAAIGMSFNLAITLSLMVSSLAVAKTFALPEVPNDGLIGALPENYLSTTAQQADTLLDIARRFDVGQNEILLANPNVDRWLPGAGAKVILPNSRVLPDTPRQGIVLNLPEYRLYYYPKKDQEDAVGTVTTNPISIGRQNWNTPLGETKITGKVENPTWIPPQSIKEEHAAKGEILPDIVEAGPDNPLGLLKFV